MSIQKLFQFFILFFLCNTYSQELPPINVFSADKYGGENQNWAISQAENKFIYVANNKGLLEYNGARWQLYPSPNKTIVRSVKAYKDRIFTGFYMDFGYWKKNNFGILEYKSIAKENNIELIEDEQFWEIVEFDGWMLFKSLQRIYLYNLDTKIIKTIDSDNRITKLKNVGETLYFQELNKGIYMIENGVPKLVSNNAILKKNIIIDIYQKDGELLFLTQDKGFFFLKDGNVNQWNIPSNKLILNTKFYSAKQLKNKDFVLGSISDGLIYINNEGTINYQITQSSGLSNNTVLSIFEDISNNIWLGLDNGINCVNNTSPIKIYYDKINFWGTIYTSILYNNILYLGTNQGLYFKSYGTDDKFQLVEKTEGQVWSLINIDDELFCAHDSGTFLINESKATQLTSIQGTWDIKKIDNTTLIQGNYDGLYILKKANNKWILNNKIEGFNNSSKYFEFIDSNKILVNHEYKNVFKLEIDPNFQEVITLENVKSAPKGVHSGLKKYNTKVLYASEEGVFEYINDKNEFVLDSIYNKLISKDNYTTGRLINDDSGNKLWSFSDDNVKYMEPGKLSRLPTMKTISIPELLRKGTSGYENITNLLDSNYLIGAANGYLIINLDAIKEVEDFNVSINNANKFALNKPKINIDLNQRIKFDYKENNIEFFYSVPNFSKTSVTKYQYQLLGQSDVWSDWNISNSAIFKNLTNGNYTFKVRAKIGVKTSSNLGEYSFVIAKPWYFSNLMIFVYITGLLLFSIMMHNIYKQYYKKQRKQLLEQKNQELELKELINQDQTMRFINESLTKDIESKNRELAISTMSLIKKNEFLNSIKNELIDRSEDNDIKPVIKIIDKNLNNTNDWKLFQEAFNNADKDFLKKVKSIHPTLTPNDLRLCAYLRLNLSSKEIAPLLNISTRSVEVKRYRLRKKMNLPHESSLTNYIIEI